MRVLSCYDCSGVSEVDLGPVVRTFDPCPSCESDNTAAGTEVPCGMKSCRDDNHHHGRNSHLVDDPTEVDYDALRARATEVLHPLEQWSKDCHRAALSLLRSPLFADASVARGFGLGVGVNHSWLVLDPDPYALGATVIDPTLWSYDPKVRGIWVGPAYERHVPHGGQLMTIWDWGKPKPPTGPVVAISAKGRRPLSTEARSFIDVLGPLDHDGWLTLMRAPVRGWPAAEIVAAMDDTPALEALVPIDLLGMLTARNPGGMYR